MPKSVVFHPATRYTSQELAAYFTAVYEGYAFPVLITAEQMAKRYREEAIDVGLSYVMEIANIPAGLFLLARRSAVCWCGGFGINRDKRGQGFAIRLAEEMVTKARQSGAVRLQLEVLNSNTIAKRVYEKAGLGATRELLILGWTAAQDKVTASTGGLVPIAVGEHLSRLTLLDKPQPCWQRELPCLMARSGLEALRNIENDASALFFRMPDGNLRILSLKAETSQAALLLVRRLQGGTKRIIVVNEPENSPLLETLFAAEFKETDRQYEMSLRF